MGSSLACLGLAPDLNLCMTLIPPMRMETEAIRCTRQETYNRYKIGRAAHPLKHISVSSAKRSHNFENHRTTTTMAEDRPRPALDDPNAYVLYRYHPSQVAAIIFVVLFSLTTALHIFQLIRKRTWYFIPLVVGGLCTNSDYFYHAHGLTVFQQSKLLVSSDASYRRTISGLLVRSLCNRS